MVLAAIGITAIWSVLDRKRPNYGHLYQWLRIFMRLVAGWAMLGYGVKKLVGAQFPPPDLPRLMQPFGQASPMGMLWTFMGASALYSFFGGFGETLGGVLLMIPRFTTLGALISGAMMTNVLMLNLCYDVPRKIFSVHLVLICLFLLIPDFRRLGNVLIFNRRADPVPETPLFDDKILNRIALVRPSRVRRLCSLGSGGTVYQGPPESDCDAPRSGSRRLVGKAIWCRWDLCGRRCLPIPTGGATSSSMLPRY